MAWSKSQFRSRLKEEPPSSPTRKNSAGLDINQPRSSFTISAMLLR